MSSFGAFDITKVAAMLKEIDLDNNEEDSDDESSAPGQPSSRFGPGQIAPNPGTTRAAKVVGNPNYMGSDEKTQRIHSIWTENEVKGSETLCNNAGPLGDDPRKVPTYETYFRQSVTTEDMFLQMGNKTPATASCEALIVEIFLPGENHHKVQLDLKNDCVELRSPNYVLFLSLPQPVDPRAGNAKWDQGKEKLILTLVLARELDIFNF